MPDGNKINLGHLEVEGDMYNVLLHLPLKRSATKQKALDFFDHVMADVRKTIEEQLVKDGIE